MIISVSRRTDIPAFYSDWFFNRIREKYVLVPNPYNPTMVSRIRLDPAVVDCFVFWSKNPVPMLDKLDRLQDYKYYFQYTLNPYENDIEPHLPLLPKRIETFKRLSDKIGPEKMIWRYDPIFTNEKYPVNFHREAFPEIAYKLKDHTDVCMIGFIDHYRHIRKAVAALNISPLEMPAIEAIALSFKETADALSMSLDTCTGKVDLRSLGIPAGRCIDPELIERIVGYRIDAKKDKNQRPVCNCIESIDIGMYESCLNGCIYCYAVKGKDRTVELNHRKHEKHSPLLIGRLSGNEQIKDRELHSLRDNRHNLF